MRALLCAVVAAAAAGCLSLSVRAAEETLAAQTAVALHAPTKAANTAEPNRTRFVIGLDRKVEYDVFTLPNPNRIVVELPDIPLRLPDMSSGKGNGLIEAVRGGIAAPGKTRVVIRVKQPVIVDKQTLEKSVGNQYQLALDIVPFHTGFKGDRSGLGVEPASLGAVGIQPPTPKLAESPKLRAAKAFKPVIVLDPGHGGMDTGATKNGTVEKDVVLAFGRVLKEQLEKTGRYRVLMTRDRDEFIELDDRRAFAERHRANLFIAIHADYAQKRARGATIFTLRDRVAADLKRSSKGSTSNRLLSADEIDTVRKASGDVDTVETILSDLAQRDVELTHERTNVFAKSVIETMSEHTLMRSKPDQQAAFRVLKTAQFPSVLIELAYVSNREDASNLNSDEWRNRVSESIVTAVENYFSNQLARLPM